MRPTYQSEENVADESAGVMRFCKVFGLVPDRCKAFYPADFILRKKGNEYACAMAEYKRRKNVMGLYPEYAISMRKITNNVSMTKTAGLLFFLIVEWNDKFGYLLFNGKAPDPEFKIKIGGRNDRGDDADVEPMAMFSISKFKILL